MKPLALCLLLLCCRSPAWADWWTQFHSPELNGWVERTLAQHPDVQRAGAAVQRAQAARAEAAAAGRPALSAELGLRAGRERSMYTERRPGDTDLYAASAVWSWEIDLLGRIAAGTDMAEAGQRRAAADQRGVELLLAAEVVQTCLELDLLREQKSDSRAIEALIEQRLERAEARRAAGLLPGVALEALRAEKAMAAHVAAGDEIAYEKAWSRLRHLAGVDASAAPPQPLKVQWTMRLPTVDPAAVIERPDVQAAWFAWEASQAGTRAADAARGPSLSLMARAAAAGDDEDVEPWQAWVGPVLKIPLGAPERRARAEAARADERQAQARFESVSLQALREMDQARVELSHAAQMRQHLEDRAEAMRAKAESEDRRRGAGLSQVDDLLLARIAQLRSEREAAAQLSAEAQAWLAFFRAQGGAGDRSPLALSADGATLAPP